MINWDKRCSILTRELVAVCEREFRNVCYMTRIQGATSR